MRYIRLLLGMAFLYEMFATKIWFLGIAALFFILQAFFNFGCSGKHCHVKFKDK